MKTAVIVLASVVLFLVAAKVHGRRLRMEREAAGFHTVNFGGTNPPEVEAIWRADRMRFWPIAGVLVAVAVGSGVWLRLDPSLIACAALSWAPSLAFFVCGLLSYLRRG